MLRIILLYDTKIRPIKKLECENGAMNNQNLRVLIVIPTYNERGNVKPLIDLIYNEAPHADILFIDDNSPDGTGILLDEIAQGDPKIKIIHRALKSGLGTAYKFSFDYMQEHNYTYLITMDADLLHDPKYIPLLINQAQEADIVIGSRYSMGGSYNGIGPIRKNFTYFWRWIIAKTVGLKCDATGSYRLYHKSILKPEIYKQISAKGFEFNLEALYYFKRAGSRIKEIPIEARGRTYGSSKLNSQEMLTVLKKLIYLSWDRIRNVHRQL